MTFTAAQIALMIQGKVEGNPAAAVGAFGKIEEAKEGELSFLSNPKYEEYLYLTKASVIICNESLELKQPTSATLIRVADAYSAFAILLSKYQEIKTQQLVGIQQPSFISPSAKLGEQVFVAAFCHIGENTVLGNGVKLYPGVVIGNGSKIGDNVILHAGVKIYHDCIIGNRVIIHSNTVVGGDGFGFAPQSDGSYHKIPQIGNVIIEDDVEIGSNTVIAAQAGISGSAKVGNSVMIGGQVGTAGHIVIADGSKIAGQTGVTKSIKVTNKTHNGTPAMEFTHSLRIQAHTRNLPEMEKRLKELEKTVAELLQKQSDSVQNTD